MMKLPKCGVSAVAFYVNCNPSHTWVSKIIIFIHIQRNLNPVIHKDSVILHNFVYIKLIFHYWDTE